MRVRFVVAIALALGIPSLVLVPVASGADDAKPATKKASGKDAGKEQVYDPANIAGLSQFMEACVEGNGKYLSRDFPAAVESYRKAIRLAPKSALGHYLLGEAQIASANLVEAEASLKQAELNSDSRDPGLRAKVLFSLADLKERTKRWDEAKSAWQTYSEWIQKFSDGGGVFPANATARIKEIDETLKLDKSYAIVRERIAAEKEGGAPPQATPPVKN
ncbi:MAG: tetratricopeptide repeat protein [Polyangiaceae bacterium]